MSPLQMNLGRSRLINNAAAQGLSWLKDKNGYRQELVELIEKMRRIAETDVAGK